ncbi:efflux RND transporter permease subunit [Phenylobacterium montanum]|uniref:Efflux RND transporter permease subunit n=1 Tax=Phenylobacterium montanum TaxID=2823693 RepID=A0A975FYN5_9CAUL|nr:efflux RND transporter permease subunit [Caulobacter sp. S6]QUD87352.1 efflux RND transporter permease subunit [Caulobacter sp. S6]
MAELRISTWGIKNPIPVALLFLVAVLAGALAYTGLPIKQFPNVTFPGVAVTITQNGAAPAEMETQVTRPVEDSMAGIPNVRDIQSTVAQGVSTTVVTFELGEDLQKVTDEVRQKVDQDRAVLPREIDPPNVSRLEIASSPVVTYAVYAPTMSPAQLSWFIDDTVSRALQQQQGVAQISRVGGVDREINVIIDPDRMAARGLTAAALNTALASFDVDSSGGRANIGGREQTIRVLGAATTVAALRELTIPTVGGQFVKLSDVADVGDGEGEIRGFARLDDKPVIGFQVLKTNEASDVRVEDGVIKALDKLGKEHPEVKFTKLISSVDDTRASFHATMDTLLEGMLLASIVVFLFLRDWRSTLITAIAMPVSLVPTFLVMALLHFSLNVVTLLALTLVIGILVDDAIVEIENIQKRVLTGARPYRAAMEGADQIGLAVVATTATVVVVFAPVSFMGSIPGQFFREFGITVAVAVLFSLLVARLLTPLLAAYFLKPTADPHPRPPMNPVYQRALDWALSHRIVTALTGGVIFILSLGLNVLLPTGVQPPGNPNFIFVSLQGPPGSTTADMERVSREVTALLKKQPETSMVFTQIGSTAGEGFGGGASGDVTSGTTTWVLKDKRSLSVTQIQDRVRDSLKSIPDARVNFQGGGFGSADVQVILASQNGEALARAGDELERQMRTLHTLADPRPAHPPTGPEIAIRPRLDEAARVGVTSQAIAAAARIATVGDIDANVSKLTDGERRIPIRIRLPKADRANIQLIRDLQLPTASGGTTPLSSVADVDFQSGPAKIYRYDRERFIAIDADLAGGAQLGQGVKEVGKLPIMKHLPAGVQRETLGQTQQFMELFGQLGLAFLTGISMIYAVLVLLFRSFFKPITILSALPLAIGGAFMGLLVMHESVSIPSLIGLLMLLGLAAKNSILLVEYAIEREREGMPQREAIMEACRERARPIIMTTMAMAAGMAPTALAIGKGSEFRQPMAVAVIGGLMTSTVLSLVMVPVVYEMIDDFEHWLTPRLARFVTPREAPPVPAPDDRL